MPTLPLPSRAFDGLAAWNSATRLVAANREMLIAIAGVFYFLPALIMALAVPELKLGEDVTAEQAWPLVEAHYMANLPWMIPAMIFGLVGAIVIGIVIGDRARPTVGQAIARSFRLLPTFLAAQLLFGMAIGLIGGLGIGATAATGAVPLIVAAFVGFGLAMFWLSIRLMLLSAVIAIEGTRSPVKLLERAWHLSRGQAGRLAVFVLLALLVFGIASGIAETLVTLVLRFTVSEEVQRVIAAIFASAVSSLGMVYYVAVKIGIYRQLSGTGHAAAEAFE